jgi:hypothetical protein
MGIAFYMKIKTERTYPYSPLFLPCLAPFHPQGSPPLIPSLRFARGPGHLEGCSLACSLDRQYLVHGGAPVHKAPASNTSNRHNLSSGLLPWWVWDTEPPDCIAKYNCWSKCIWLSCCLWTVVLVYWSEFLATDPEVPGYIPGTTRFSEK